MSPYPITVFCGVHAESAQLIDQTDANTASLFSQMTACGDCQCRSTWTFSLPDGTIFGYWDALQTGYLKATQIGQNTSDVLY